MTHDKLSPFKLNLTENNCLFTNPADMEQQYNGFWPPDESSIYPGSD